MVGDRLLEVNSQNMSDLYSEKCKLRPWLPEYHSMDFYPVKGQGKESLVALCKCIENCRPGCEVWPDNG